MPLPDFSTFLIRREPKNDEQSRKKEDEIEEDKEAKRDATPHPKKKKIRFFGSQKQKKEPPVYVRPHDWLTNPIEGDPHYVQLFLQSKNRPRTKTLEDKFYQELQNEGDGEGTLLLGEGGQKRKKRPFSRRLPQMVRNFFN